MRAGSLPPPAQCRSVDQARQENAAAAGHLEGFIKVIFDAKYGEWLGTHMIGYNVTELIAETVTARKLETTYQEVLNSIHPHPTISESVKDAIEVAYGEAIHL